MKEPQILRAAAWMIGAILALTSMAVTGRIVLDELDTFELMLYRSIIGVCVMCVVVTLGPGPGSVRTARPGLHLLRNASHFAGQNLWFFALTLIPLSTVFALEFTSPIWVMVLAGVFLGERLTLTRVVALVAGFLGVLVVVRPGTGGDPLGLMTAALAAIGFAGSMVATRSLTSTESVITILFWLTVTQAVFGLVFAGFDGGIAWPSASIWPALVAIGLAGLAAHFCLTTALSLAPATIVVPIDFARLPLAAVLGVILYNEALDPFVILGAALIFGGNYLNIWRESRPVTKAR
jgi:drug/metabolite transporter (DMT)-like permease